MESILKTIAKMFSACKKGSFQRIVFFKGKMLSSAGFGVQTDRSIQAHDVSVNGKKTFIF